MDLLIGLSERQIQGLGVLSFFVAAWLLVYAANIFGKSLARRLASRRNSAWSNMDRSNVPGMRKAKTPRRRTKPWRMARHLVGSVGERLALVLAGLFVLAAFRSGDLEQANWWPFEKSHTQAREEIAGVASVIDGDTIEIRGQRIRLEGIDAPESRQICIRNGTRERCGQEAAIHLADRIGRLTVTCEDLGKDRYNRVLGICHVNGEDLNDTMVRDGHAVAYRQFSKRYVRAEQDARTAERGIWGTDFELPWDWRKKN